MTASAPRPRSLADDLRRRSDDELVALLRERPDLADPVPDDVGQLAVRAGSPASAARALDRLDRFALDVVDALCVLPDAVGADDVTALVGVDRASVVRVLERLRLLALWWGSLDDVHLVRAVRDVIGPYPAGLGPPAAHAKAPTVVAALDEAPEEARDVVARLADEGPVGELPDAQRVVTVESARTPVEWLLARGVLTPVDESTVALVREVGLHLRGGLVRAAPSTRPPSIGGTTHDPQRVASTAAHAATETLRLVEKLLELWSVEPPSVLRSGGVGVRDVAGLSHRLDVSEEHATLLVEVAHAAGLVNATADADPVWLPTEEADDWLELDVPHRWTALAVAWLETPRAFALAGTKDERGNRLAPLSRELERGDAAELRAAALEELAAAPPGTAATEDDVVAALAWRRPRRASRRRSEAVGWTLHEAELLGVTGLRALSEHGRALLTGDADVAVETLAEALPTPVDHVLLQADLTAVAPGPLEPALARELALVADVESTGGATVYRFTEASLRRALDAGRDAAAVHELLERSSLTPVPQPLTYLVDDVARRHGLLRVGVASSYVRCDDEGVLAELLADRRAAGLRLRRLAPTVVASPSPPDVLLERVRELGYAPAAETPEGDVVVAPAQVRRAPAVRPSGLRVSDGDPGAALAGAAVRVMRAADGAETPAVRVDESAPLARMSAAETAATLRAAAADGATVRLGCADGDGGTAVRVVDALRVAGGFLTAYDHAAGAVRTFALHRVTAAAPVDGG